MTTSVEEYTILNMEEKKKISPVMMVLIAIGLIIVGSIAVFFFFDTNNALTVPGLGTIGLNSKCSHNDPDLCKFINRGTKADYFNGTFAGSFMTTNGDGTIMKSEWEMDRETASRMANYENDNETFHMIIMKDIVYVKDPNDGSWWKQQQPKQPRTNATDPPDTFDPEEYKKKTIEEITQESAQSTYTFIGKEACEQRSCFKYEVKNADRSDTKEYIFFDDKEYILRKSISEKDDGSRTETTYAYGNVSIKEPKPIKEAAPGQNIFFQQVEDNAINQELEYIKEFEEEMKKSGQEVQQLQEDPLSSIQVEPTIETLPSNP